MNEPALAAGYTAFLASGAALLERSARRIRRERERDGEVPWPHSDAAALRRVLAATLLVLAVFIAIVEAYRL